MRPLVARRRWRSQSGQAIPAGEPSSHRDSGGVRLELLGALKLDLAGTLSRLRLGGACVGKPGRHRRWSGTCPGPRVAPITGQQSPERKSSTCNPPLTSPSENSPAIAPRPLTRWRPQIHPSLTHSTRSPRPRCQSTLLSLATGSLATDMGEIRKRWRSEAKA